MKLKKIRMIPFRIVLKLSLVLLIVICQLPTLVKSKPKAGSASPTHVRATFYYISTVAGTGSGTTSSGTGGLATAATIASPRSIWGDSTGVIFFSEYGGHIVRKFAPDYIIVNVIGVQNSAGQGSNGIAATSSAVSSPAGICGDSLGTIYIADNANHRVRYVTNNIAYTFGGTTVQGNTGNNGKATAAKFDSPQALSFDTNNNLYIGSSVDGTVRMIANYTTIVSLIAGLFICMLRKMFICFAGVAYGNSFTGDYGPATSAKTSIIQGVAINSNGSVLLSDSSKNFAVGRR